MSLVSKYVSEKNIKRKNRTDKIVRNLLMISAILSASFIIIIIAFNIIEGLKPLITNNDGLGRVKLIPFLTGMEWLNGVVNVSTLYGIGYLIINTLLVVFVALLIAVPVGVITGLFIAKIAPKRLASVLRTITELLASIPSVIYGVFGMVVITTFVVNVGGLLGISTYGGSSFLATSIMLSFMIMPTITVMSENSIRAVDKQIEQGSLALGATDTQTQLKVLLPAAKSGIFAGIIIGVGRALGEATAVSMIAGNATSGPTLNPFERTATLTSQMLLGFNETTGLDYDIRFTVGLVLMVVIIITNILLKKVMRKFGNIDEY